MTFLSLRNLFLFVSVSVHQLTLFEYLIISYQLFYEMTQLVIIMVSFNIGTRTPLQFSGVFKPSRILFTPAGYFYPSDQYFIATSANWLDMTGPNSSLHIFSLFISSNILKSFAALFSLPDWFYFSASWTIKLMSWSNTSFHALQISQYSQYFCWVSFEEVGRSYSHHQSWVSFEEVGRSYSHHQRTDQFQIGKHWLRNQSDILYHFLLVTYWRTICWNKFFQIIP